MFLKAGKVVAAFGIFLLLSACSENPNPKDKDLLENFKQHQTELSRVVHMLGEDRKLQHLWPDSITPKDAIDEDRWDEYRRLMSSIGSRGIHANLGKESAVMFRSDSLNYASYDKGYVYSEKKLEPLKESLDLKRTDVPPYHTYYRHIEGNWYLYYENQSD
jgi:hypothetical protein